MLGMDVWWMMCDYRTSGWGEWDALGRGGRRQVLPASLQLSGTANCGGMKIKLVPG